MNNQDCNIQKKRAQTKFFIVKKAIDQWNPYNLLPAAPSDEFDNESSRIAGLITDKDSAETIALKIADVFQKQFDDTCFSLESCLPTAEEIKRNLINGDEQFWLTLHVPFLTGGQVSLLFDGNPVKAEFCTGNMAFYSVLTDAQTHSFEVIHTGGSKTVPKSNGISKIKRQRTCLALAVRYKGRVHIHKDTNIVLCLGTHEEFIYRYKSFVLCQFHEDISHKAQISYPENHVYFDKLHFHRRILREKILRICYIIAAISFMIGLGIYFMLNWNVVIDPNSTRIAYGREYFFMAEPFLILASVMCCIDYRSVIKTYRKYDCEK